MNFQLVNSIHAAKVHREIVDEAIKIAIGITKPDEYQIKAAENQQSE